MTQRSVERVLGRLVTDEAFRRTFGEDPEGTLAACVRAGTELNPSEVRALCAVDRALLARFADTIDPRLQKADLGGGRR
jgi:hypothetical protein